MLLKNCGLQTTIAPKHCGLCLTRTKVIPFGVEWMVLFFLGGGGGEAEGRVARKCGPELKRFLYF